MPCRPLFWFGFACVTTLMAGCNATVFTPATAAAANAAVAPRVLSPTEQSVAVRAIRDWHRLHAVKGVMYELDRYDRRINRSMRNALRDICPALPPAIDREDPTLLNVSIDQVELPLGNYAFATLLIGNRFDSEEHAFVYEYRDAGWVLLDHYLIAKGLMDVVMVDFSWRSYCREKGIRLPPEEPVVRAP